MAKRRTNKGESLDQESYVAQIYGGEVVKGSGAVANRVGDVRTKYTLIECKTTGTPAKPAASIGLKLEVMEKIADEAWSVGLEPALALRFYAPDSVLADTQTGYVNLMVRLMANGRERTQDE